jgi:NitT/TauT family transport system substrate-binding protein
MIKRIIVPLLWVSLVIMGCGNNKKNTTGLKDIEITIDWTPVAEYYGIYYAKESGLFKKHGYNVTIQIQNGAPIVANLVGTGTIPIGTTTSDDILRSYAKKHRYSAVRRLFTFNPSSIITLKENNISTIDDLRGKTLGVNPNGNPYLQLKSLIETNRNIKIGMDDFKENPSIGWGGAELLLNHTVDAILAYTTNQALDVKRQDSTMNEVFLGDYGAYSYGLVLAFADETALSKYGITKEDVKTIYDIIIEGYEKGFDDIERSILYLKEAEPTLKEDKVRDGIKKIGTLNNLISYPHSKVDEWLIDKSITENIRAEVLKLYNTTVWSGRE